MIGSCPSNAGDDGLALRAADHRTTRYMSDVRSQRASTGWRNGSRSHDFKGYEPFDGLTSFLLPLTLKNQAGESSPPTGRAAFAPRISGHSSASSLWIRPRDGDMSPGGI